MDSRLAAMEREIRAGMRALGRVVVAYSGGVDSALVADVAFAELGSDMIAFLGESASLPPEELAAARALAATRGFPLAVAATHEQENPEYLRNDTLRCYHCKDELFTRAWEYAHGHGYLAVADGTNLDDLSDFRPGTRAGHEQQVARPLAAAGLTKSDVRALAQARGLPVWDKPAAPCLASRLPYGEAVTPEKLASVAAAERCLRALGFAVCRVRHHGDVARIEVPLGELARFADPELRDRVVAGIRAAGYAFVALDLQGFRSGSLNLGVLPPPAGIPRAAATPDDRTPPGA